MQVNFAKAFAGKKILITGGTGSIGSEIVLGLIPYKPSQIRIYSRDESKQFFLQYQISRLRSQVDVRFLIGDIRDKERLDKAMWNIDIVFHAAALKHVTFCEYNPFESIKTNVYGTQNVIDLAIMHNVKKVIGISTDKAVYPINIMGTTKLLMEKMLLSTRWYLADAPTKFSVVRFGNVLGSRGSVSQVWKLQISNGDPLSITDPKMTRYFMEVHEAVNLIFKAATMMKGQEIFVLKMVKRKITDLAAESFGKHINGKRIPIKITGRRHGEKLHEDLFTKEEKKLSIELNDMYILIPYEDLFQTRSKSYSRYTI